MGILTRGDTVGIVACSNGLDKSMEGTIEKLTESLVNMGIKFKISERIYKRYSAFNGTGKQRADILMNFYKDEEVKAIFDVSGGDLSNEILDYLNYDEITLHYKPYFGYSDLTVVLNALYSKTHKKTYLYQVRNLVYDFRDEQIKNFKRTFMEDKDSILNFNYEWIQGSSMEGIVVGGNIRCLLKLAGTQYMPDFQDKILFLESFSGDVPKMATYLTQYKHMGVFYKIKGIILGSFTEMENENYSPAIEKIVKDIVNNSSIPIAKTSDIGHGKDSKCIIIGDRIKLTEDY